MCLFLFYCFSFSNQEKFSSGLVSSITMQQFEFFWKLLENLRVDYVYYFQQSLSSLKWTQLRASFYQFSELIFIVTSKHWTETHSLNDKIIVWCKYSRVIKDLSKGGSIFLLNLLWRRPLSYRDQSIDLLRKSMDWFLYDTASVMKGLNVPNHSDTKLFYSLYSQTSCIFWKIFL